MWIKALLATMALTLGACGEDPKCGEAKCGSLTEEPVDAGADDIADLPCEELSAEQCGPREGCIEVSAFRFALKDGKCESAEMVVYCRTPSHKEPHCSDADVEIISCDPQGQIWFSSHDCMPLTHHECTASEAPVGDIYANRCQEP